MIKVLFVCLGNICRSPLAEGVFEKLLNKHALQSKFKIDSAGTASYHIGSLADERSRAIALKNNIKLIHRARAFVVNDFDAFDLIVAMDENNRADINAIRPIGNQTPVLLMRFFETQNNGNLNVPDPYYGNEKDFEMVYQLLKDCCTGLVNDLAIKHSLK